MTVAKASTVLPTSRLTRKYQATIPKPVRDALGLGAGDTLEFDVNRDVVRVRKARPIDRSFAAAVEDTLQEWTSEADDRAYRGL